MISRFFIFTAPIIVFGSIHTIPVSIDGPGKLNVNATLFDPSTGEHHLLHLTLTPTLGGIAVIGARELLVENGQVSLVSSNLSEPVLVPHIYSRSNPDLGSVLTLGWPSRIGRMYQSVSLIKNDANTEAKLMTGLSREQFEGEFCTPGSLMSLERLNRAFSLQVHLGTMSHAFERIRQEQSSSFPGYFAPISEEMNRYIRSIFLENGIEFHFDQDFFSNCRRDILTLLPDIRLEFVRNERVVGRFVFLPDEYLSINESDNTCKLLLFYSDQDVGSINTFEMRGVNTRISFNAFDICDTLL